MSALEYNYNKFWSQYASDQLEYGVNIYNYNKDLYTKVESELTKLLSELKGSVKTVLEIGCGFGRVTNMVQRIIQPELFIAIDMAPDALANAMKHVKGPAYVIGDVTATDSPQWPTINSQFDLVISCEMLMHIKPEHIFGVITRMFNLTKLGGHIITHDYTGPGKHLASHNFKHNYVDMFTGLVLQIEEIDFRDEKQSLFHCIKIRD